MKHIITFLLILSFGFSFGQVTFVLTSIPDYTPEEDVIYIAGNFNSWNPGDPNSALEVNDDGLWEITLDPMSEGTMIEFKFTRGDWGTVEKGAEGEEIPNRTFTFGNGETEEITIENWADNGGGQSTAAWNVAIMDESFYMPQLDRNRRIWIYLPPGYDSTEKHYPVIYMHDGQNLFDEFTSFAGEWEVDETLNKLSGEGYLVPIVVGIDNGGIYRIDELTPWNNPDYGGGQGDEYMAFIVETLKPHVDENYRTLPDRDNTGIIGSSLGGLISTYGAMKHQDVFSKSGPFSPAYWINNDSIWSFIMETGKEEVIKFYQNVGQNEGDTYIDMMYMMEDSLRELGFNEISSKVIPDGNHNEATWRDDFETAYLWLFNSYATNVKEFTDYSPITLSPNPVGDKLSFKTNNISQPTAVQIIDSSGKTVIVINDLTNNTIDVKVLKSGVYFLRIDTENEKYLGKFIKY